MTLKHAKKRKLRLKKRVKVGTRKYINNDAGGQIHLVKAGAKTCGTPSLLLIHQTPRSSDEFREVIEALAPDHHVIALDLPGMGASSPMGRPPTIETYAKAAALVIEHFGTDPMIVCGHHTGGVVAIELSASRPELVSSLILSSTPWIDAKARQARAQKAPIDTTTPSRDGAHIIDLWQQRSPYYPADPQFMHRYITTALQAGNPADGHHAVGQYHMEKAAPKIKGPTLLIEHMKDPFAAQHLGNLIAAFPEAIVKHIPDGLVAIEPTADQFAKIIRRWINSNDTKTK